MPCLNTEQRQALELLARYRRGAAELFVYVHHFKRDMIAGLVRTGLATVQRESMKAGGKTFEVVRLRITDAGRHALTAEG
jgi:hypothetical protein